jgi:integral membrane protein (TIGR01906 family)
MNLIARIATVLFIVAVPVFLITSNVRFAAGDTWFYERGFRAHDVDQTTGIDFAQLDAAADDVVRYFEDDRETLNIQVTVDGREGPLYSDEEVAHMRDVKGLMRFVFRLHEASLGIVVGYVGAVVLWTRERTPRDLARYALYGVATGLAVVAGIGAFAVTGFDAAWTKFHEIAFRNDLWQLDPDTDRLIQMFPEPFWEEMTYFVGLLTVVEVLAVVVVAAGYLVWGRDRFDRADFRAAR